MMKISSILLIFVCTRHALANVVKRTTPTSACFADNCLRGVRGTDPGIRPPLTSRLSDCSSFMKATVTPAPTTTTITIATVTITPGPLPRGLEARQATVSPSMVPAYATYCPASSSYSSACSCLGITKTTLTIATPTLTEYATATATYVPPACGAGLTSCDGTCANLDNDNINCGTCGNVCGPGFVCGQGACVLPHIYSCTDFLQPCGLASCGGYCFEDVTGVGYCKKPLNCAGLLPCKTGADCPSTVCLINNCGNVCAGTEYLCPNNLVPRLIFKKREGEAADELRTRDLIETELGLVDSSDFANL